MSETRLSATEVAMILEPIVTMKNDYEKEIERLNNIIKRIKDHFVFLKMNSDGGNKEFFEDIIEMIEAMEELKGGKE